MRRPFLCAATALSVALLGSVSLTASAASPAAQPTGATSVVDRPTLSAWSVLPAQTFTPASEPSGHFLAPTDTQAVRPPFPGQPVQGFSATHRLGDGSYLVMSDNGFGAKANSADYQLAVHRVRPGKAGSTKPGKTGYLNTVFTLSDPHGFVSWPIWRDGGCARADELPSGYRCPTPDRQLTGWDFDLESMQVAPDGTFWFGEEFGPFLLHTDQLGRLLAPPMPTPGVTSPSNPTLGSATANLANSKGFEGMSMSPDGTMLHPMLEGATAQDKAAGLPADLRMYDVRLGRHPRFTGDFRRYRMEAPDHAIGDLTAVDAHRHLVIERDDTQGEQATFKRIYLIDTRGVKPGGYVRKSLLVDLMDVADPGKISGSPTFTFPYFTIENVEIVDDDRIAVMNDNNFPATGGRGQGVADVNEYIEITLPRPLRVDERLLGRFVPYGPHTRRTTARMSVVGDIPYGDKQVAAFPGWVDDINAGRTAVTVHVGDIKSGSTRCDDSHLADIKTQFDRFAQPLVYTPGDNEWTDCHRPNNGGYDPLERLAALRRVFFATPGLTGGTPMPITSEAANGFPENVTWRVGPARGGVSMSAIHVVGSNDGLAPWTGRTEATPEQAAEQKARMGNAIALVRSTFGSARAQRDRAVVIHLQADMFDPTYTPEPGSNRAFVPLVQTLIDEATRFEESGGEVYLIDGDSHVFHVDRPLAAGSRWLDFYGVRGSANLTRITVDGSTNNTNWLRVSVHPNARRGVLSWVQVPYTSTP